MVMHVELWISGHANVDKVVRSAAGYNFLVSVIEGGGGRVAHNAQWQSSREVTHSDVGWGQKWMDKVMEEKETSGNRT